jgi:alanyl aminopeptidase
MFVALGVLAVLALPAGDAATPPALRLPGNVRPVRQAIELAVDPNLETFSGSVAIELDVREPTKVVWLNGRGLEVTNARLGRGGDLRPAQVVPGGDDFVGFRVGDPLSPGPARLEASFEGTVSRRDQEGIFAVEEGEEWYAFTQFEAIAARRAFPCFDEPSYKIPWEVSLRVPHGAVALSNTPVESTRVEGGRDVVRFSPTPPLPSYLVAFVVGPFDIVEVGPAGRSHTPTRLVVPRGRGGDTAWARESTPRILALLEDYFDRPYPFRKLDEVAIPGAGFAMENPGLVTYGQELMVQRPAEQTLSDRRDWARVCAHELAHMWFGDLVTTSWWDDTWLNEAFANWLEEKTTERYQPDWGLAADRAASRSAALRQDSLTTARRIRQPITSNDDIINAFDGVTYGKGQAVLEMVEAWLGEDVFRRGVKAHINRHAGGNATAAEFIDALSAAAGRDVGGVLGTFLDQTGAPVIEAEARCDSNPRLVLSQRPYRALGSPAEHRLWSLPVCVRVAGRDAPECTLLSARTGEIPLGAGECPEWFYANAGASGYYRTLESAALARRILEGADLTAPERVALAGDLGALVLSGDVSAGDALSLLPLLASDDNRHVVIESARVVSWPLEAIVPDSLMPRFRRVVREVYGARARSLGWSARPGDSEDVRLLREPLLSLVAGVGDDRQLEREAAELARGWLDDPSSLDPDMVDPVLYAAAGAGDRELFDRLRKAALQTGDRARRERLLRALGGVRDPALVPAALALTTDQRLEPLESVTILFGVGSKRETRRAAFDFVKEHYDALVARLPRGPFSPTLVLPWVGARLCTPDAHEEIETFFEPRSASLEGAPRMLRQALEVVDQCVALRKAQEGSLAASLQSSAGS